jgi:hypothetical protein
MALNARALDVAARAGDDHALAYALQDRGWLATDDGRYDDATRDMRQAVI